MANVRKQYFQNFGQFVGLNAGLILLFLFFIQISFVSRVWIRKSDALKKRGECASILYKDKIFIFGGFGEHPAVDSTNEVYDPATDKWSYIKSFPAGKKVTHQAAVLIDDKIWLIGGRIIFNRGPVTSQVLIYDIANNNWRDGPSLTDPATNKPLRWAAGGAALLGRTLHVFGGIVDTMCNGDQDKYHLTLDVDKWFADPANTMWKNDLAPLPVKRNHLNTAVLGGKIYAIGGQLLHDCGGGKDISYVHTYDPINDVWIRLTDLPSPRSHAEGSTFALDGKIYVAGGQATANVAQKTVLVFTPENNKDMGSWDTLAAYTLPDRYLGMSAAVVKNTFVISHGSEYTITNERYETYAAPIKRNIPYRLGFVAESFDKKIIQHQKIIIKNLLYTIEGVSNYTLTTDARWLTVTKNATGISNTSGTDIEVSVDGSGLAKGSYAGVITATGSVPFSAASFCINIEVSF